MSDRVMLEPVLRRCLAGALGALLVNCKSPEAKSVVRDDRAAPSADTDSELPESVIPPATASAN